MSDFTLTQSQSRALDLSKNIAVTAGAGSGKTFILVRRYLDTLAARPETGVRNVLAITFTERAAAEMKARVRESVEKMIRTGHDAQRWREILETLDHAAISTIHSFCSSLLREYPVEAGIDPLFSLIDQPESERLKNMAVSDTLQEAGEDGSSLREELRCLLRLWGRRRTENNLLTLFYRSGADAWAQKYASSTPQEILDMIRKLAAPQRDAQAGLLFSQENCDRLAAFTCTNPGDRLNEFRNRALDALRRGADATDDRTLAEALSEFDEINLKCGGKNAWDDLSGCKSLLGEIRSRAQALAALIVDKRDESAIPALQAISRLYLRARQLYADYKGHGRLLDFDDLQAAALDLLRTNKGNIRSDLHRRFVSVLVDEFQDTNDVQWEIIRLIVESPEGGVPEGKLFIVGDPKQSIYRFREADITVFNKVKRDFISRNGHVEMDDNFRTLTAPVAFVNSLADGLMGVTGYDFDPEYRSLVCRRDIEGRPGSVRLLFPAKTAPKTPDAPDAPGGDTGEDEPAEADLVARQILAFIQNETPVLDDDTREWRPAQLSDVAVLLQARTRLDTFEDAFRRHDIPFSVVGGYGFYERQEVMDVVSLLSFLLYQNDDVALAGLLRSPMVGVSDDFLYAVSRVQGECLWSKLQNAAQAREDDAGRAAKSIVEQLHQWIVRAQRMSVEEILAHVFEETGVWGSQTAGERGEQVFANMEKILGLARNRADLHGFVERLRELIDRGAMEGDAPVELEGSNCVRILTVHAAKGLEFPIVFLVDTHHRLNWGGSDDIYIHPQLGFGIKTVGQDGASESTTLRELVKERVLQEEEAESIRLMYVGMTRARDHLVISGTRPLKPPQKPGTWLHHIFAQMELDYEEPADLADATVCIDSTRIAADAPQTSASLDTLLARYRSASDSLGLESEGNSRPLLLKPVENTGAVLILPATALARYIRCPRAFYLGRMLSDDQLREALPEKDVEQEEDTAQDDTPHDSGVKVSASKLGNIAHRLFEEILNVPPGGEREAIRKYMKEEEITDRREQGYIIKSVEGMASQFRASELGKEIFSAGECYCEVPFSLSIGCNAGPAAPPGVISGKIDCLYRKDGVWKVVDYKTDNVSGEKLEKRIGEHRLQLLQYILATQRLLDTTSVRAYLYFTRPARAVECEFAAEQIHDTEQLLLEALQDIAASRFAARSGCTLECGFADRGFCSR